MQKFTWIFVCVFVFLNVSAASASDQSFDLERELEKPFVKLVVIDFFSVHCKPCMEAMPRWKGILEKYRGRGLRFVAVSAEKSHICSEAGWSPDIEVCDTEGVLQERFDIVGWPTYLLYSWDGNTHIVTHDPDTLESEISRYFKEEEYRLTIAAPDINGAAIDSNPVWVHNFVTSQVRKYSKFTIVSEAPAPVQAAPKEKTMCQRNLTSNSILRIVLEGDLNGNRTLSLSLEKDGCIKAQSTVVFTKDPEGRDHIEQAIQQAIRELISQIVVVRKADKVGEAKEVAFVNPNNAGFGKHLEALGVMPKEIELESAGEQLNIPQTSLSEVDTYYLDLINQALLLDKSDDRNAYEKISAWIEVADYAHSDSALPLAEDRIRYWQTIERAKLTKATYLRSAFELYQKDKKTLEKLLAYPDDFIAPAQKQAYNREFSDAYGELLPDFQLIVEGTHALQDLIDEGESELSEVLSPRYGKVVILEPKVFIGSQELAFAPGQIPYDIEINGESFVRGKVWAIADKWESKVPAGACTLKLSSAFTDSLEVSFAIRHGSSSELTPKLHPSSQEAEEQLMKIENAHHREERVNKVARYFAARELTLGLTIAGAGGTDSRMEDFAWSADFSFELYWPSHSVVKAGFGMELAGYHDTGKGSTIAVASPAFAMKFGRFLIHEKFHWFGKIFDKDFILTSEIEHPLLPFQFSPSLLFVFDYNIDRSEFVYLGGIRLGGYFGIDK